MLKRRNKKKYIHKSERQQANGRVKKRKIKQAEKDSAAKAKQEKSVWIETPNG